MRFFFPNTTPLIKYGIGQAFRDRGHEALFCNVSTDGDWQRKLESFRPDFVFTDGGWYILDHLFPYLHYKGIPHIYWAIDDPPFFESLSMPFARQSRYVFTTCLESIEQYAARGIRAYLLPFGFHPGYFFKGRPHPERYPYDIVFFGNNYDFSSARIEAAKMILQPLMDQGYNIKIFGNEWWLDESKPFHIAPQFYGGGYFPMEELSDLCASVPIIIGLHSVVDSQTMMSMRTFEILGCGGFHLSQWSPAIQKFFKNHKHLVWTRSRKETIDLVDYFLAHPEKREAIAREGRQEVLSKHTYYHRVDAILKVLLGRAA